MRRVVSLAAATGLVATGLVSLLSSAAAVAPVAGVVAGPSVIVVSPGMSIQAAVDRLGHGGTVELTSGHYHQRVRLVGVAHVTVQPAAGAHAVLDGAGLTPKRNATSALITIADSTDVEVQGLALTGYRTSRQGTVPIGIYIHGHDHGVRIIDNHVHDLGNDNGTLGSFTINAHGIAAYGDDPNSPITGLTIKANTVDHLKTGASETVVVNGNVIHWAIVGNHIYDDNNIGIDAIGFEPTLPARYRYTTVDRARDGLISDNQISHIRSRGNPSYWDHGWCDCADGIYVDGGTQIRIEHNEVTTSDIGIEVAAENRLGTADFNTVTRNHITKSLLTGLATGGYCNGAKACGGVKTGASHDNVFTYNVLRGNNQLNDGSPEVLIQYHAYRNVFRHNTITATNQAHLIYGTVPRANRYQAGIADSSNDNTFRAVGVGAARAVFGWLGRRYVGFAAFTKQTGEDHGSRYVAG